MKKWTKICLVIGLMLLVSVPLIPAYVMGWKQRSSALLTTPNFTTHQWLAQEALKLAPSNSMFQWITNHQLAFWLGVEAAYNSLAAAEYDDGYATNYGNINSLYLYLDVTGTIVTEGNLSARAQEEYEKLVIELSADEPNEEQAAFYAGAMSHYVSQAGFWGAIWNSTLWGTLNVENLNSFENYIDNTLDASYFDQSSSQWKSTFYTLSPTVITPIDAENGTINLAKSIHSIAQSLGDDFDVDSLSVEDWTTTYNNNVIDCLTSSVEVIYAVLKHAMDAADLRFITIPNPEYEMNVANGHMTIPEFSVTYTNVTGTYALTESLATIAEYRIIINPEGSATLQPERTSLKFNVSSGKWYHDYHFVYGLATNEHPVNHTIVYTFQMVRSVLTWSNYSDNYFAISFFPVVFNNFLTVYNPIERTLVVSNIQVSIPAIPELGFIDPSDTSVARWFLYQKGEGTQTSEPIGQEARTTEGDYINGSLIFDPATESWYSETVDIGLIFTPVKVQYYVIVRFGIEGVPTGYLRQSTYGTVFVPFAQKSDDNWFGTRDHQITITKPEIDYNKETQTISIYNIRAWSDYKNTTLDYYEIYGKSVHGDDKRTARWTVFLYDGIASALTKTGTNKLQWDGINEYWFTEDIDVSALPDNYYYVSSRFVTMNVNATTSPWGPTSDMFQIIKPIPVVYYILPEIFLIGFLVLFGWLVWYKPMMKKKQMEKERLERIDHRYKD